MDDDFSPFTIGQLRNHCGPCSLSYCMYVLGIEATQRKLARAAGLPLKTFLSGMEPPEIIRAARAYGVIGTELEIRDKSRGTEFAAKLRWHLNSGNPAMLLVWDCSHWIALPGCAGDKFVVSDPDDEDRAFSRWTERTLLDPGNGWNRDPDGQSSQYCAILLKRKDGKPSRWKITDEWLNLCAKGSEEKLSELADDVVDLARRSGGIIKSQHGGVELSAVLKKHENLVIKEVAHWVGADISVKDLRDLYRAFTVTADSLRLRVPKTVDGGALIAQMTSLLTTFSWTDTL